MEDTRALISDGSPAALDDGGVLLVHLDLTGLAQHVDGGVLQLHAQLAADDLAAGEDGDVLQHGLAAVAKARSLDGNAGERAAQLVEHQRGKRFALDVPQR